MRRAYFIRYKELGDPDFNKINTNKLLDKNFIKQLVSSVDIKKASSSKKMSESTTSYFESDETAHIAVLDASGLAVSSTHSLNSWLGSAVIVPGTGILLNNHMDDFTSKKN